MDQPIPEGVRRFVLTSVPSVPHLETLLLLWRSPGVVWTVEQIAARLYVQPANARAIAEDLARADLIEPGGDDAGFRSRHADAALASLLAEVEVAYSRQLRAITELIHSNLDRKAANFAQAFSWRKT
jgi:DNA-binding MarR family transcriptional regulator